MHNFLCQIVSIFLLCILPKLLTTWRTQFCVITYSLLNFDVAYTTRTNLILWLNLNYKKLLKCVDTTEFLCINLNFEKSLKCADTLAIFISDTNYKSC